MLFIDYLDVFGKPEPLEDGLLVSREKLAEMGVFLFDTDKLDNTYRSGVTNKILGFNKPACFKILVGDDYLFPDLQTSQSQFLFGAFYDRLLESSEKDENAFDILKCVNDIIFTFDKAIFRNGLWYNQELGITHDWLRLSNSCRTVCCLLMDTGGNRVFKSSYIGNNVLEYSLPFLVKYSNSTLMFNSQHTLAVGLSTPSDRLFSQIYSVLLQKFYSDRSECIREYCDVFEPIFGIIRKDEFFDYFEI